MREIKFRAWNTVAKRFYPLFYTTVLELNSGDKNDTVYMQYTGLKDKNGKEIYEEDIVKTGGYVMVINWNTKFASFCLVKNGWMYDHFFGEATDPEQCEVIGNIYENPELLK